MNHLERLAPFAIDLVIVISLTLLAALGRLDAMVVVGVVGPLVGARVASHARARSGKDDGGSIPPSGALLLMAGAAKLFGSRSA